MLGPRNGGFKLEKPILKAELEDGFYKVTNNIFESIIFSDYTRGFVYIVYNGDAYRITPPKDYSKITPAFAEPLPTPTPSKGSNLRGVNQEIIEKKTPLQKEVNSMSDLDLFNKFNRKLLSIGSNRRILDYDVK